MFAIAVSSIVIAASLITIVALGPAGFGAGKPGGASYNVTATPLTSYEAVGSGWARYGSEAEHAFLVEETNLTWVVFTFSWSDEAGSPFADPEVRLTYASPNGTVVFSGPAPRTSMTWNVTINALPSNGSQEALSEAAALEMALQGTNATAGVGNWTWKLEVGNMPLARNQIRSGVFTDYSYQWGYFEAAAKMETE